MRRALRTLVAALALAASACDGDDAPPVAPRVDAGAPSPPAVDADHDGHVADADCDDTSAAIWQLLPAYADLDGDGHGAGDLVSVCSGSEPPPGHASTAADCAPDDGARWVELAYAFRDADGDGRTIATSGSICSGGSLPTGHHVEPGDPDCDDADATSWALLELALDEDLDGVGAGELVPLCTDGGLEPGYAATSSDCAPADGQLWQELPYGHRDHDLDGATVPETGTLCAGVGLPATYLTQPGAADCDDADATVAALRGLYPDVDDDGVGAGAAEMLCAGSEAPPGHATTTGDCAPEDGTTWRELAFAYRDADRDGHTVPTAGTVCAGAALPAGYANLASGNDCADQQPTLHTSLAVHVDEDSDGVGAGSTVTLCTNGSAPDGYSPSGDDCAPASPLAWQVLGGFADADGDSFTVMTETPVCSGGALPPPFRAARSGNDCDDASPAVHRWVSLYSDADGDGHGQPPRTVPCLGQALPEGLSLHGDDVDDDDPDRFEDDEENEHDLLLIL